jgi:hypothetical protein
VKSSEEWNELYSLEGLSTIKVGDIVAPVEVSRISGKHKWRGALHPVTSVSKKQFVCHGDRFYKKDGKQARYQHGNFIYVPATAEMIAEAKAEEIDKERYQREKAEFNARPEVVAARQILSLGLNRLVEILSLAEMEEILQRSPKTVGEKVCTCPEKMYYLSEPNDSTCTLSEEEHQRLLCTPDV